MKTSADSKITRFSGIVRGERRKRFRDDDGNLRTRVDEIEADIEIEVVDAYFVYDLGRRAIRNGSGKATEMGGIVKAKALRPRTLSTRIA